MVALTIEENNIRRHLTSKTKETKKLKISLVAGGSHRRHRVVVLVDVVAVMVVVVSI